MPEVTNKSNVDILDEMYRAVEGPAAATAKIMDPDKAWHETGGSRLVGRITIPRRSARRSAP